MVMSSSNLSINFLSDKLNFFPTMRGPDYKRQNEFTVFESDNQGEIDFIQSQNTIETVCTSPSAVAIPLIDAYVIKNSSYSFLLENLHALETEFTHMFTVLQRSSQDKDKQRFWFYCYYCASLLEAFHLAYGQMGKVELYQQKKREIKAHLGIQDDSIADKATVEKDFIETLKDSLLDGMSSLIKAPFHVAQIRDHVAYTNICRIYWVFCRLTVTQGLTMAKNLQLIDKLDVILGTHTDVDKIIATMRAPTGVINYFSVGLFLARFMIDGAMLIKHTFFPSEQEKGATTYQRFKHEFYKRHCNFANDLVWATVNFLTNFNHLVGISAPVAGYLTSVFLVFDIGMTFYKLHLAEQEYLIKQRQYTEEARAYQNKVRANEALLEDEMAHYSMLIKQRLELDINWEAKKAMFHFVAAAAALLMMGFTASLLLSPPGLVLAAYFTCTIGVAMYLSYGSYFNYKEKKAYLNQALVQNTQETQTEDHKVTLMNPRTIALFASGSNYLALARKEYETARNDFIFTMVKNTTVPAVLITTYAICWPAAVALTVLYLGYELLHAFNQHQDKKEIKGLALGVPEKTSSPTLS